MPRARPSFSISSNAAGKLPSTSTGPPSPTFSETTNISQMSLTNGPEKIITRADLKNSLQGYEYLMNTCTSYRAALLEMSKATASFADAMQTCSNLKGASYDSGARLQASAGLHHLMGNQWHILSNALEMSFEIPLRQYLDGYRRTVSDRTTAYEKALVDKSRTIKQIELEHMNVGKKNQPRRNLQTFRETLATLQRHVDELDVLKASHYQEIYEHEEEVWDFVQGKICIAVRSTLDIFDRFASKASDPVLEPMLNSIPDPFDSYGPPKPDDQIFSILPPLAILNQAPSPSPSPLISTPVMDRKPDLTSSDPGNQEPSMPWITNSQHYSHFSSSEWADAVSPRSTSPVAATISVSSSTLASSRSISPAETTRRHSAPAVSLSYIRNGTGLTRKAEATLRNVLSVIDEGPGQPHIRETSDATIQRISHEKMESDQNFDSDISGNSVSITNALRRVDQPSTLVERHLSPNRSHTSSPKSDDTAHL